MSWSVYILFCNQKTFYVGIANNLGERPNEHIRGYSPYTRKFSNIKLVYSENDYRSRYEEERREKQLKGWSIAKKKTLISGDKELLKKLSRSREIGDDAVDV